MGTAVTDRIEKQVVLKAPRSRVWRALTTAEEFGTWFGAKLSGTFAPGARIRGPITHKDYDHLTLEFTVEEMVPERRFSWRWHPNAVDPAADYSKEPSTLVVFELDDAPGGGTLLKVVETGFDGIPLARRMQAYRGNDEGWAAQMQSIARHVGSNV